MTGRVVIRISLIGVRAERPKPMRERAPVEPKPTHQRRPRERGRRQPSTKGDVS